MSGLLWSTLLLLQSMGPPSSELTLVPAAPSASRGTADAENLPIFRIPLADKRKRGSYEPVKGRIVVRARVAERDVSVLVDNRAERSLIDLGFAREVGLPIDAERVGRITADQAFPYKGCGRLPSPLMDSST